VHHGLIFLIRILEIIGACFAGGLAVILVGMLKSCYVGISIRYKEVISSKNFVCDPSCDIKRLGYCSHVYYFKTFS
jgi:hypothetical protein